MPSNAHVKPGRRYDASRRRQAAALRRRALLEAAAGLFVERGYAATTMSAIAERAGVNVDTLYATVGTKPQLFELLLETALSGVDVAVPVEQRDYVRRIRAEPDARGKLAEYASAVAGFQRQLAPLHQVARSAAAVDGELVRQWDAMLRRRASNIHLLIDDLATTGRLRHGLARKQAADTVTAVASPEVYVTLTDLCGWDTACYETWLADTLTRLLLDA